MAAATFSISAFTTMENAPNVINTRGNVRILSTSPSVTFARPITTAAIMAVPNPEISMPGTMAATITRLSALKSQLTSR